jgi:hypothetical protein
MENYGGIMSDEIKIGSFVKIRSHAERFWVQVQSLKPLIGRVDNYLCNTEYHGMSYNDIVCLRDEEILIVDNGKEASKGMN